MTTKSSHNIWIQRHQCPCGDWKCYLKQEGDDHMSVVNSSQLVKSEISPETIFTPYVGQIFKSDDDASEHYNTFARQNGFSIRKARSSERHNMGIYRRDFVCYRSGFNQPRKRDKDNPPRHYRERKSARCGCDAKLHLTKEIVDGVSQWFVAQFSNIHNHELLEDDQVRLLPAYRKIQEYDQERILLLSKAGFPVNRIVKLLELEKGVRPGQLPFIEKDVRNFVRVCKKTVQETDALLTEKRENDMSELLKACKTTRDKDVDFVYDYTTDQNDKVENVAWSYRESIHAYTLFGDVVALDTAYRSITYGLLLVVWFGIDNHGNAIFFGCALLQDETSRSFAWALQSFHRFMGGRFPQTMLTDMDPGLKEAMVNELPNTKQVISISHINSKLSSWFSDPLGSQYTDFKSQFNMVYYLENTEDFDHQWNHLMDRFGLDSDKHAALLFSYRASWPICYTKNYFLARMTTTEYCKSLDTFMERILSSQTCLQVFFEQVGNAANFIVGAIEEAANIKTHMPIEEHARSILSPFAFQVLQQEIMLSMQYVITEMANGSYMVRHFKKLEGERLVVWISEDEQIHCSCKEFDHSGLLCRHSIRVFSVKNYFQLPEKYFPLRWRQDSSLASMDDQNSLAKNDECAQALRALTSNLLSESLVSKERFDYAHKELTNLFDHVKNMPVALNSAPNNISEMT